MPRPKKDGKFVNVYMEKSIADAADRYSEETGVPKTKVIEKALEEYLAKQVKIEKPVAIPEEINHE